MKSIFPHKVGECALLAPVVPVRPQERTKLTVTPQKCFVGNGPNTVSESAVSNTELSEFFGLAEFRGESLVSSSPIISVPKHTHRIFQNSPSLRQNSVSPLFRNSAPETVFRPFPISGSGQIILTGAF